MMSCCVMPQPIHKRRSSHFGDKQLFDFVELHDEGERLPSSSFKFKLTSTFLSSTPGSPKRVKIDSHRGNVNNINLTTSSSPSNLKLPSLIDSKYSSHSSILSLGSMNGNINKLSLYDGNDRTTSNVNDDRPTSNVNDGRPTSNVNDGRPTSNVNYCNTSHRHISGSTSHIIRLPSAKDHPVFSSNIDQLSGASPHSHELNDSITNSSYSTVINTNESLTLTTRSDRLSNFFTIEVPEQQNTNNFHSTLSTTTNTDNTFECDETGNNALHHSIAQKRMNHALQIIASAKSYESLNIPNHQGKTALHLAVETNQPHLVRQLICAGAYVDAEDENWSTPLHLACQLGYVEPLQRLLKPVEYEETVGNNYTVHFQQIPQDMDMEDENGRTCLELALIRGDLDVIRALVESRAFLNPSEKDEMLLSIIGKIKETDDLELLSRLSKIVVDDDEDCLLSLYHLHLKRDYLGMNANSNDKYDILYCNCNSEYAQEEQTRRVHFNSSSNITEHFNTNSSDEVHTNNSQNIDQRCRILEMSSIDTRTTATSTSDSTTATHPSRRIILVQAEEEDEDLSRA